MDWDVDFMPSIEKEDVKYIRDTLEAKLKAESGQYGEAARILWELLVQLRHEKKQQWECITMVHMGIVYRALRWNISVSLFEDALELAEKMNFSKARMMALAELGEMKCQWGKFDESLDVLNNAFKFLEPSDLKNKRLILLDMVIAYEGLDEMDRCADLLQQVISIDRETGSEELDEDLSHLSRIEKSART